MLSLFLLVSCAGGGTPTVANDTPLTGTFLDSPVAGLEYETDTVLGITDAGGHFTYHEGEMIRFFVGDIELGQTVGQPIITPMHLVDGVVDENHPMVTNMLVFLQILDVDGEPANGIQVTDAMRQEAMGVMLDFSQDPNQFMLDYDMNHYWDLLESGGAFSDHMAHPVSVAEAWGHMRATMGEYGLDFPNHGSAEGAPRDQGEGSSPMHGTMP